MSSRTRNIKELHYYCREIKPKKREYDSLKSVETKYKKLIKLNEKVLSLSKSVNENDEVTIVNNTFFKLFCYNEYIDSFYNTGFIEHFESILKANGFILTNIGEYAKLEKEEQNLINLVYDTVKETDFDEYVENYYKEMHTDADEDNYKANCSKHAILNNRLTLLNIPTKPEAEKYKQFIMDEYYLKDYYDVIKLLRTDDFIKLKLNEKIKSSFKVKTVSTVYNKVLILSKFESHYKISRLNFDFTNIQIESEIKDDLKLLINEVFRTTKNKYNSQYELLKLYVLMIKNICGDLQIVTSEKGTKRTDRKYKFILNIELLKDLVQLMKYKNPVLNNFDTKLIETHTSIKPDKKPISEYLKDEDNDFENYLFNKTNFKQ
jgi:hypothetical protein